MEASWDSRAQKLVPLQEAGLCLYRIGVILTSPTTAEHEHGKANSKFQLEVLQDSRERTGSQACTAGIGAGDTGRGLRGSEAKAWVTGTAWTVLTDATGLDSSKITGYFR